MSKDVQRFRNPPVDPPPPPWSRMARMRKAAVQQYEQDEMTHALETAEDARRAESKQNILGYVGQTAFRGQTVTKALGEMRDRVLAEKGESLTTIEVDNITQQCQAVVAEVTVEAMRDIANRRS